MESSPSKRRKLSPTSSARVNTSNAPGRGLAERNNRTTHHRSSFFSPTKASLARFNPNLLPKTASAEPNRPRTAQAEGVAPRAQTEDREVFKQAGQGRATGRPHTARSTATLNGVARHREYNSISSLEDTPSRLPRSILPGRVDKVIDPVGKLQTPTHGRQWHASGTKEDDQEQPEPSLPSTPSQLGLEAPPEKPKGLLFQSPGRRHARRDSDMARSSPHRLKNPYKRVAVSEGRVTTILGPISSVHAASTDLPSVTESVTLARDSDLHKIRRRLSLLQDEMTRTCIESMNEGADDKGTKSQRRLKSRLAKDARSILRDRSKRGGENNHGSKNQK